MYHAKWFVAKTDILTYTREPYDDASDLFGLTCTVYNWSQEAAGTDGYIVKITAYGEGYYFGGGNMPNKTPVDKVRRSYSVADFYWNPQYWGIREADDKDVANKILNTDDPAVACSKGDWIFPKATASSAGVPEDKLPFISSGSTQLMDWFRTYAGLHSSTTIYEVKFYTTKAINETPWIGVNGSFGSGTQPKVQTTSYWKAINQKADEKLIGKRNYIYLERRMQSVPFEATTFQWKGSAWDW